MSLKLVPWVLRGRAGCVGRSGSRRLPCSRDRALTRGGACRIRQRDVVAEGDAELRDR